MVVPALSMRLNLATSSSTNSASVAALVTRRSQGGHKEVTMFITKRSELSEYTSKNSF